MVSNIRNKNCSSIIDTSVVIVSLHHCICRVLTHNKVLKPPSPENVYSNNATVKHEFRRLRHGLGNYFWSRYKRRQ